MALMDQGKRTIIIATIGLGVIAVVLLGRLLSGGEAGAEDVLANSKSTDERVAAIGQLERQGSVEAAETLTRYIQDADTRVASRAVYALGRSGKIQPTQMELLNRALGDQRPQVREAAVVSLATANGRKAPASVLEAMRSDGSQRVRAAAATAVGHQHQWDAMPALIEALRDPSAEVRRRAHGSVMRMMGLDMNYRAEDPPAQREAAIARIESLWPHLAKDHVDYMRRRNIDPSQR